MMSFAFNDFEIPYLYQKYIMKFNLLGLLV